MNRIELELIQREARVRQARQLRLAVTAALDALRRWFAADPAPAPVPDHAERFMGLANFQERLKNSRPPRIEVIRSIKRSKCSGTSTKFRRSLFTMSSGLSE